MAGFTEGPSNLSIYWVSSTTIRACVAILLLIAISAAPGLAAADSSTDLELRSLADRARARQASIESQLASLDTQPAQPGTDAASERARLEDLRARNARVLEAYDTRLSRSSGSSASAGGPAAPESSGGGFLSGITSKVSGLFGGGSTSNPNGPTSQSWGGAGGGAGGFDLKTYLKDNWPGLVGGMVGSIAGGMIASRLAGGNKLAGIAGSLVGGWLGQKGGEMIAKMIRNRRGGGSSGGGQQYANAQPQYAPPTWSQSGGQPVYQSQGVQITYPAGYQGAPPAAPAGRSLAEQKELVSGRYQAYLASASNPQMQASMFQNYVQSKAQYDAMLRQARSTQ
jgi:hypothetical protein